MSMSHRTSRVMLGQGYITFYKLDSYEKDSGHIFISTILDSFRFRGQQRFIFTMDIKSLYTVIPNDEALRV